ncbi:MAG: hypothetical protein GF317_19210 [Candidatus Lokiarchaeota archaeon]|nr:hypothetical protein [Candidatus Lokiarchaeota archaeon]MBD3201638.1 hypothetical protein [Candidatus Lokiarchaeota archaeon]
MSEEDIDFIKYARYHNISDFANFSLKDIITLQFLVRYREPIVRHLLYTEVKQFIEFKEMSPERKDISVSPDYEKKFYTHINDDKQLYPPSFYNMLNSLEEKGLVKYEQNVNGKIPNIEATPYTNFPPQLLLKFLINNNVMVSEDYREKLFKKFADLIQQRKLKRILSIWFSEYVMVPVIKMLSKYSDEQYILPKNGSGDLLSKTNIKKKNITEMISNHISAPEHIFDGILIPVYKKEPKFHNMTRDEILKETLRILEPGGLIMLVAIEKIPTTDNIFLDELIKLYSLSLNNRIFSKKELKVDMEKVGFKNIEISSYKGLLIGIGKKS